MRRAKRCTILVVDDGSPLRFIVRRILEGSGYIVKEAGGGKAAFVAAAKWPIDLLLTDFMMPGMHGVELAQRLSKIPTLFMTGNPIALKAAYGKMPPMVMKPFTKEQLLEAVSRALKHS